MALYDYYSQSLTDRDADLLGGDPEGTPSYLLILLRWSVKFVYSSNLLGVKKEISCTGNLF